MARISRHALLPGGVPGPGGCTWYQGGVPGPGEVYLVPGVYLVLGGVPGPGEVYLVLGGVPGPGGCACQGTPPLLWTESQTPVKI